MSYVTYDELSQALEGKLLYNHPHEAPTTQLQIVAALAELITRLHAKHPQYVFCPRYFSAAHLQNDPVNVTEFRVQLDGVVLGFVKEWSGYFYLRGERISAARPRTNEIRTKDIKRAAAAFTKHFKPETDLEVFQKQERAAKDLLWRAENDAREKTLTFSTFVKHFLVGHIIDNFETYADIATRAGATPELVEAAKDAYDTAQVICSAVAPDGYTVVVRPNMYLVGARSVGARSGPNVTVFDGRDLPKNINDKLGKLKLVTPGTHIRDTGLRVNENTFYVTEQKSDE